MGTASYHGATAEKSRRQINVSLTDIFSRKLDGRTPRIELESSDHG